MKITSIQTQKKRGRYNIFVDGKYLFAVSEDVLVKYSLHKGQELTPQIIEKLKLADNISKSYSKALDFLSYQIRTKKEIKNYLSNLDIPQADIDNITQRLEEQRLLNDTEYAKAFVRTQANTSDKGPNVIFQKLLQKGVSQEDIEEGLTEYSEEQQLENTVKLAKKQFKHYQKYPFNIQLNKVKQALMKKGFTNDIIQEAIDNIEVEPDLDEEYEKLVLQANKLWDKYSNNPKNRAYKVKSSLYRKGFNLDMINQYLSEQE